MLFDPGMVATASTGAPVGWIRIAAIAGDTAMERRSFKMNVANFSCGNSQVQERLSSNGFCAYRSKSVCPSAA
jgi:hypothetical protein